MEGGVWEANYHEHTPAAVVSSTVAPHFMALSTLALVFCCWFSSNARVVTVLPQLQLLLVVLVFLVVSVSCSVTGTITCPMYQQLLRRVECGTRLTSAPPPLFCSHSLCHVCYYRPRAALEPHSAVATLPGGEGVVVCGGECSSYGKREEGGAARAEGGT